jgi:glycosyltransferase involved in cell wall biosynthesis
MKLLEAAALGIVIAGPPIAVQGLPFREGDFCPVVREGDWPQKIQELLANPALRERLAMNARKKVEDHCSWDESGHALSAAYEKMLADSSRC